MTWNIRPKWKEMQRMTEGKIDYQSYRFSGKEICSCVLQIIGLAGMINYLCYRKWWIFLLLLSGGYWYEKELKESKKEKRKLLLYHHFKDVLQGLLTSLRAGYSIESSISECRKEMENIYGKKEDLVNELYYMEQQMKVGVPAEQLFLDLGRRSGVEDIQNFAEVFLIARRSGGNLGEILEQSEKILGEKIRVHREIQVAIAAKKMEQRVMSLVPGGMLLYMQWTSDGFLDLLYGNWFGAGIMTGCLILYFISFYMGKRIVDIKV